MNTSHLKPLILLSAMLVMAAPATAKLSKLTVSGRILAGTDGGNDLIDVSNVGGVYVHTFAPGTFFGAAGSLAGKALRFTWLFDPSAPNAPTGIAGVFEDMFGDWALASPAKLAINGVSRDIATYAPGTFAFGITSTLTLGNGPSDSVGGDFSGLDYSGGNLTTYDSNFVRFTASLPGSVLGTDALLPGALPGPGFGYGSGIATGFGSFDFTRSMCFIECSSKRALGTFALSRLSFGAVPEPANWAMLVGGFAFVGTAARRRRTRAVAA